MTRPSASTPATAALTRRGITYSVLEYEHDPRAGSFGAEAADALGLDPECVFKTLVAVVDERAVLAVVPVAGQLDLKALADAVGGRRARMAAPAVAERLTGSVVGGISPVGQRRPLPVVIDESVILFDVAYVSGGRRGLDIGLAPDDLVRATDGQLAAIARP